MNKLVLRSNNNNKQT